MIDLTIHTQPDDESCGPTSLHALYRYYGLNIELEEVIKSVERSHSGGTLAALLGKHALERDFSATIYVNNVSIFDPTWFDIEHGESCGSNLSGKLIAQMQHKTDANLHQASNAYLDFIKLGGQVRFHILTVALLKKYFAQKIPILTGLSATYLYRSARERFDEGKAVFDDIRGTPCGHFVVLCGYDDSKKHVVVADPHWANPISRNNYYKVSSNRLINAILLGVLTYDANLLIIQPKRAFNANNYSNG
ncbi:Peptidase C39 family protein [Legionella massiliensis]|uniref:Peptidase C39 family protein n=1 Tax=Legionella massiliensis TaxID=1034943 RepID=A0A078KY86_9GAMM|nr:peptidase C39 [Legionella massiliensis]CDZ78007.1 Peptidase C39 family protein [Legionella massiliensis]CEE13745.1 Peptidase C39 family protein [Legionella massiliensis]